MNFKSVYSVTAPEQFDCLVFAAFGKKTGPSAAKIYRPLARELNLVLAKSNLGNDTTGYEIFCPATLQNKPLVALVQLGNIEKLAIKTIQKQISNVIRYASESGSRSLLVCWSESRPHGINLNQYYQLLAQYCAMTEYQFAQDNNQKPRPHALRNIVFFDPAFKQQQLKQSKLKQAKIYQTKIYQTKIKRKGAMNQFIENGKAIAQGINLCKSMSNLAANRCTPSFLAKQAVELARHSAIQTTIIDEEKMKKLKMHSILAVSKGSDQSAKLIVMSYNGADSDCRPVTIIGKGVTFDSGGYSIKSASGMQEMKFDMCGAASVIGTMHVISMLKLAINVIAIIPCSENLVNGRAFKPGDVLTSMSGQTVEILSTDAEGRLLLADALTYSQRFNPALVIDVATLTGAAITALGYDISAIMSNDQKLSKKLCRAGQMCHDYLWPLPVWEDYSEVLNSNFADFASSAGRDGNTGAGAIVAACFLSKFMEGYRWAHLDVAGTAWHRGKHMAATGRPVALLSQFLINYSNKSF